MPAWFIAYTHADVSMRPTDTIYGTGLTLAGHIHSLTSAANNTLVERYIPPDFVPHQRIVRPDTGRCLLATDTLINLRVPNSFYHQLPYRYATHELAVH